jgi:flagellin
MTIGVNITQTLSELFNSRYTKEVSDSVQRLTSGLKINDAADDVGGLVSISNLSTSSSDLKQGIENGTSALALVQISNKALDNQSDILNLIKEKLDYAKYESTSATSRDAIRVDIIDLLQKIDDIAADTNYNNVYTLQKSNSDNDYSLSTTITLDSNNSSSITTESIKSNSEGLSLDTLKNLTSGELTSDVAVAQLDIVDDAINTIDEHSSSFDLSQTEIEIAVENLTGIEKTTRESKDSLLEVDNNKENAILDKFKLLEKSSEFAIVQANITQARVLNLLSTPLATVDYDKDNSNKPQYDNDKSKNDFSYNTDNKTDNSYSFNANSYTNNNNSNTPTYSANTSTDV